MKFLAVFVAVLAVAAGNQWTLQELSDALQNPNTDPAMIPFLEEALNEMMTIIWAGGQIDAISVGSPIDLNPIAVNPIGVNPISPMPVVTPVESESAAPLVQIIVNVRKQQEAEPVLIPVMPVVNPVLPEIIPVMPVVNPVLPEIIPVMPVVNPIVPEPVVLPAPVAPEVHPQPVILPAPVAPEVVINPIDTIAVGPL